MCNCGYATLSTYSGKGVGRFMCAHSLQQAVIMGFTAMQYNFVISTNCRAVRLWHAHGFETVGTLPKAFFSPRHGLVNVYVMFKSLV